MIRSRRLLGVATLSAALLGATAFIAPSAAVAQERTRDSQQAPTQERPPRDGERSGMVMDEVKSRCLDQIERRQTAMAGAKRRLSHAQFVTDEHEAALVQNLDATSASLSRLADVIQSEDNFEELRAECRSIVEAHRVYVLVIPRVRLVVASDAALAAAARLTTVADRLQAEIDNAKAAGKDTTEAESDLARMRTHIGAARAQAGTVYGAVINLTPADYNANHQILDGARQAVRTAKDELRAAVAAAREVRAELRS